MHADDLQRETQIHLLRNGLRRTNLIECGSRYLYQISSCSYPEIAVWSKRHCSRIAANLGQRFETSSVETSHSLCAKYYPEKPIWRLHNVIHDVVRESAVVNGEMSLDVVLHRLTRIKRVRGVCYEEKHYRSENRIPDLHTIHCGSQRI